MIVLDTREELDARAVCDDEDGLADDKELWGAEVETTAEVDVVIVELDQVLAPAVPEFAIGDEKLKLDDTGLDNG